MSVARAISTGDLAELPSRRQEDWRWTDIRGLIRNLPAPSTGGATSLWSGPFASLADREIRVVNGKGEERISVPAGAKETISLRVIAAPGAGAHAARLSVRVGEGAQLTLLEGYEGQAPEYLSEMDIDFDWGARSGLERIVIGADGAEAVSVSIANISMGAQARLSQAVMTSGARRQRIETRVRHPGAQASVRMDGIYVVGGRRHADITTVVIHEGVDGTTDQLVKGVVRDQARGVFQGRIVVRQGCRPNGRPDGPSCARSVGSRRGRRQAGTGRSSLTMSSACAHGNTVGSLDEEALFYARQRGVPEAEARRMLMTAFLEQVVDRINHEGARRAAHGWVRANLETSP